MRQITIEIDDEEMVQLEAAARARDIDPARMSKEQLLKLLTVGKKPKWRAGLSARRNQLALKAAQLAPRGDGATGTASPLMHANGDASTQTQQIKLTEAERERRLAILMTMEGVWKDDPDKPQDGVAYQKEVRAEWRH